MVYGSVLSTECESNLRDLNRCELETRKKSGKNRGQIIVGFVEKSIFIRFEDCPKTRLFQETNQEKLENVFEKMMIPGELRIFLFILCEPGLSKNSSKILF